MTGPGVEFDWKFFRQLSMFGIAFISTITLLLYGCECENPKKPIEPKYKQGDVVWLKPDSTRAVVVQWYSGQEQYEVHYYDKQHEARSMYVEQFGIYSIVNN
jgi:hypothetical protein